MLEKGCFACIWLAMVNIARKQSRDPEGSRITLLETAIELIWNASYESIGVNEICTRAGVTKGCFYHHFNSKAELFYAASDHFWSEMKPIFDDVFDDSKSGVEQLLGWFEWGHNLQLKHSNDGNPVAGCPFFTTGALIGNQEPLFAKAGQELSNKARSYYVDMITKLQNEGHAEKNREPEQLARLLSQYVQGLLLYARVFQSFEPINLDSAAGIGAILGLKPETAAHIKQTLEQASN